MVVPLAARSAAAVVGALLVLMVWASVVETLIVPRVVGGWLTSWAHPLVDWGFRLATSRCH